MTRAANTHWVWEPHSTGQGVAFVTRLKGLDDEAQSRVLRGEALSTVPKVMVTDFEPGLFADVLGAFTNILFVSSKVRGVIEGTKAHVQWIPASVRGRAKLDYWMLNALDTVPAIDRERSKYDTFAGTDAISRIHRLRLRPIPEDKALFHAAEDLTMILISGELQRRLREVADHPGVITPAEEYRNQY